MVTAVISDLHLGASMSMLRHESVRSQLLSELQQVDQVVLLGDVVALRAGPVHGVLEAARPFFEELGAALAGRRVLLVPGNHDHELATPLLERRRLEGSATGLPLEVSETDATGLLSVLAGQLGSARLAIAYPGVWLRPDLYATHGHYLDCHLTVPRPEAVAASLLARLTGGIPGHAAGPSDYEAALAPIYSFAYAFAQAPEKTSRRPPGATGKLWRSVKDHAWEQLESSDRRDSPRRLPPSLAMRAGVAALNAVGLGPFSRDISPDALGRAGVNAMTEVVARLGIEADYIVFGHTHRAGPAAGEPDWQLPNGSRLFNSGSWSLPLSAGDEYLPGTCLLVEDIGPPRMRRLLGGAAAAAVPGASAELASP